ncbi:MAG: hypothetical protein Q8O00_08055 [Holophaga sp.]|nr:hypothetical protein [Holophaga sp.]
MRCVRFLTSLIATAVLFGASAFAQDPALKETFQQAKVLWGTNGDRDGSTAKFEQVLSALEPKGKLHTREWLSVLSETYNWLAVLDGGSPTRKARANKHLESLLEINPDFELDRSITSARLVTFFDGLRASKLVRVKLALEPEGGILQIDGHPRQQTAPLLFLSPGNHRITYAKAGFQSAEQQIDLVLKEAKTIELKLVRTSSTVTLYTVPTGVEVLLDGKSLGKTSGQAAPELRPLAEKAGVTLEQLAGPLVVDGLSAGTHTLELQAPCFKTRRIELDATYAAPFQDHLLEAYLLEPSRGLLTVNSTSPGGELYLNGTAHGSLPAKDLQVCTGSYDLKIRFPAGGFSQRIEIAEGKSIAVNAHPKARMVFLGLEGADEFAGRDRLQRFLETLGNRLESVAYMLPAPGETPQAALARIKLSKEAELTLLARPIPGKPIHEVELIVSTLQGEEDRSIVKPLEQDPLEALAGRLNQLPRLWQPWIGVHLLDLPNESGPWVMQADDDATRAGIKTAKAILQVNGKAIGTVAEFQKALTETTGGRVDLSQGDATLQLPITQQALEIPLNASNLCYPFLLAELRLRYLGAKGDEAGLLRLNQALALMHFRSFDKAMEVLRDARVMETKGVSQGTLDYYTGLCLLRLGNVYTPEAIQAFTQALKYPQATLFGPEGPLVAPLARQALDDLKL